MNKVVLIYGAIALTLCCILSALQAGCSGAQRQAAITPNSETNDSASETFLLVDLPDHELTDGMEFRIVESGGLADVVITANTATSEAFGSLKFDPDYYTPIETRWDESVLDGKSVYLVLTDQPGEVPFGIARLPEAAEISVEVLMIRFKLEPQLVSRRISKAPQGDSNVVDDLVATPVEDGTVELEWSERNIGDYDNSGEVGVADITPIAQNYLAVLGDGLGDEDWEQLIDGDGSGDLGIPDITPIASNYLSVVAGYHVYRGIELPGGDVSWESTPIKTVPRPAATVMRRLGYKTTDDPLGVGQ
jgi:hypothetical protein